MAFASIALKVGILSIAILFLVWQESYAKQPNAVELAQQQLAQRDSELDQVNDFVLNSRSPSHRKPQLVTVNGAKIYARLLTPINSKLSYIGDEVHAVVTASEDKASKPWLPVGTILDGCIEGANKNNFGQTDACIYIRFYTARVDGQKFDLLAAPDTENGALKPSHYHKVTKKEQLRGILMVATRIAVPAAIGTGGISIAITAGAGAVIGGVLAEKGEHIKGAARGAWQGAGLCFLDPLVRKGLNIKMAEGSPIMLQLSDPVEIPKFTQAELNCKTKVNGASHGSEEAALTNKAVVRTFETHAQIVDKNSHLNPASETTEGTKPADTAFESDESLAAVRRYISQNNLASAVNALHDAEARYPGDARVQSMHEEIYKLITGSQSSPSVESHETIGGGQAPLQLHL